MTFCADRQTGTAVSKNSDAIQKAIAAIAADLEDEDDDEDLNDVDIAAVRFTCDCGNCTDTFRPPSR